LQLAPGDALPSSSGLLYTARRCGADGDGARRDAARRLAGVAGGRL